MTIRIPSPTVRFNLPQVPPIISKKVAVIGAGAAGLVAAHELRLEGHRVAVFERENQLGGTWVYTSDIESDPIGLDPTRNVVHTSLYSSLRTNLPREVMGFRSYPFVAKNGLHRDPRRFPGHREVLEYLKDFANEFELNDLVRFGTEVWHAGMVENGKWEVRSKRKDGRHQENVDEIYDAIMVCNGHFTEPRIAEIPGIETWPGKQIHSHNYRIPEPFRDQIVVLIGNAASAHDISREISEVAKEVHVASRSAQAGVLQKLGGHDNIWLHSVVQSAREDGSVAFQDGTVITADIIMHCTGYKYYFPFLETNGTVTLDDNRVGPLYKHIFPPTLSPWLSFVGVPWKVAPFLMFEFQSKWVAGILSDRISLPSVEEMMADVKVFYSSMEASGIPKRFTHNLEDHQFEYDDWLAAECGCPPIEKWRKQMYVETSKRRMNQPETYRDQWEDEHLISQARGEFSKHFFLSSSVNKNQFIPRDL